MTGNDSQIVFCGNGTYWVLERGPRLDHRKVDLKSVRRIGSVACLVIVIAAFILARDIASFWGFVAVLTTASIPFFLWTRRGAVQLPIFPVAALFFLPSYASAAILGRAGDYTPVQILGAELTVALFLGAAGLAWSFSTLRTPRRILNRGRDFAIDATLPKLMLAALSVGAIFEIGIWSGWWMWMGNAFGTFRTVVWSATILGCFLYGVLWGRHRLSGTGRTVGGILMTLILVMEVSSLFLYGAILYFITVCLGYFLSARKVPWVTIAAGLLIATILHSAKEQMRDEYWSNGKPSSISLSDVPGVMTEWLSTGINNMVSGAPEQQQNFVDRASMLPNLLLVQQSSPQDIPFLEGETYANFWKLLVPRFIAPNKITSQTNLNLLSVHYHLQRVTDTATTTISWGLVAEAYANFGIWGVALAGLAFGVLLGLLTSWTAGAPTLSLRGFIGLASMVVPITSVGYDFSFMLLCLLQSIATMVLLFLCLKLVYRWL